MASRLYIAELCAGGDDFPNSELCERANAHGIGMEYAFAISSYPKDNLPRMICVPGISYEGYCIIASSPEERDFIVEGVISNNLLGGKHYSIEVE